MEYIMKIGFVGLGKMGMNMTQRLLEGGHQVVVYDVSEDAMKEAEKKGASLASTTEELVKKLEKRRVIWLMIPAGKLVDEYVNKLGDLLDKDDIVIDGGNSHYTDSLRQGEYLAKKGIQFIDCGTSGGVWGLKVGYCLMYGGDKQACDYAEPIFKTLAPENGYLYCGKSGSGHFVKMVHNGIEYGIIQSID
jgi:6-phosphogluconate dehydrogenase